MTPDYSLLSLLILISRRITMGYVNSYTAVAVCTLDEAKQLLSAMISNFAEAKGTTIEPKSTFKELYDQFVECNDSDYYIDMAVIDPDNEYGFEEPRMDLFYLKNGIFVFRYGFASKYSFDDANFITLYNKANVPFYVLQNPEEMGHCYSEIPFNSNIKEYSDSVNFFTNYYNDPETVWDLLDEEDDYLAEILEGAAEKPAPDLSKIIMDPDEIQHIMATDPEKFEAQRRLIADLVLWDGWDPAKLQPYMDFLEGKEVDREEHIENYSVDEVLNSYTIPLKYVKE